MNTISVVLTQGQYQKMKFPARARRVTLEPCVPMASSARSRAPRGSDLGFVAEREGFEPPGHLHARLLSRSFPAHADHPVCRRPARQGAGQAKPVKVQRCARSLASPPSHPVSSCLACKSVYKLGAGRAIR